MCIINHHTSKELGHMVCHPRCVNRGADKYLARPGRKKLVSVSETRAISTTSRRELSTIFFFSPARQDKTPKEINAILTETLDFSFLVGLRIYQHPCTLAHTPTGTVLLSMRPTLLFRADTQQFEVTVLLLT